MKRSWLVFVILVASCAPAGIDEPTASTAVVVSIAPSTSQPAPTTVQPDGPVTVVTLPLPATPTDYGIYRDVIFGGAQMVSGSLEFTNWWAVCLGEHGFSVTVIGPAESEVAVGEQDEAFQDAIMECDRRAVNEGVVAQSPLTGFPGPETLALWYRAYVEVAYECLRDNGFPTNPPPSVDEWVENYPDVWHPHDAGAPNGACTDDVVELLIELGNRDEENGAP